MQGETCAVIIEKLRRCAVIIEKLRRCAVIIEKLRRCLKITSEVDTGCVVLMSYWFPHYNSRRVVQSTTS